MNALPNCFMEMQIYLGSFQVKIVLQNQIFTCSWNSGVARLTKGPGAKNKLGPQLNCLSFINTSQDINSYI